MDIWFGKPIDRDTYSSMSIRVRHGHLFSEQRELPEPRSGLNIDDARKLERTVDVILISPLTDEELKTIYDAIGQRLRQRSKDKGYIL